MKTTNWQTKALTLFIAAAAALRLTVGSGKESLHPDSPEQGPEGQGSTGKRRTLFLTVFGGGLFVVALAIGAVLLLRPQPYEDILGLEPCVDDFDFEELVILESVSPPFSATVYDDWSLNMPTHRRRNADAAVKVVLEHEDRFKAITAFTSVAVNKLYLRDSNTDRVKQLSVKHGILVHIAYRWSGRIEDLYRWLPGCLDGYPVLAAWESGGSFPMDTVSPPRWGDG